MLTSSSVSEVTGVLGSLLHWQQSVYRHAANVPKRLCEGLHGGTASPFTMSVSSPTNTARDSIHVKLDMELFAPARLRDEVFFRSAMSVLEGHVQNPVLNRLQTARDFLSNPRLFIFVYSGEFFALDGRLGVLQLITSNSLRRTGHHSLETEHHCSFPHKSRTV